MMSLVIKPFCGKILTTGLWKSWPVLGIADASTFQSEQIHILQSANEQLVQSFDSIHNLIRILQEVFSTVGVLFALISAIGGISLFRATKLYIEQQIQREIQAKIERFDVLEDLLAQRSVLSSTSLYYYQPDKRIPGPELKMLQTQIKDTHFHWKIDRQSLKSSDVVVFDLVNSTLEESEAIEKVNRLVQVVARHAVLVIYTSTNRSPVVSHLMPPPADTPKIDFSSANMKITLMERAVSAAIASAAIER